MKLWSVLLGVLVISVLTVGCGGGGDETITKTEFIDQADAICAKAMRERDSAVGKALEAQEKSGKGFNSTFTEKVYVETFLPPLVRMTDELEELDEPASEAQAAAAVIASFRRATEADPAKVADGEVDPFLEAKKKAAAFGLEKCSES